MESYLHPVEAKGSNNYFFGGLRCAYKNHLPLTTLYVENDDLKSRSKVPEEILKNSKMSSLETIENSNYKN